MVVWGNPPLWGVLGRTFPPPVPPVGVPPSVAVPFPLFVKVTPLGRVPDSLSAGVGDPVVVTVKLPAVPTANVVLFALVILGAVAPEPNSPKTLNCSSAPT